MAVSSERPISSVGPTPDYVCRLLEEKGQGDVLRVEHSPFEPVYVAGGRSALPSGIHKRKPTVIK